MEISAKIQAIEYHIPRAYISNEQLAEEIPNWSAEKITKKTGINKRFVADVDECSSDLAIKAANKLFSISNIDKNDVDYILLCTQSPDYFLPTTACIIQDRLGIDKTAGALDINLGCSGFIYGLGLAKGLIETGQSKGVLFITAETYSKFIHSKDGSVRSLFSDGAAAVFISPEKKEKKEPDYIGPFVYGTDGSGAENLIVKVGGLRNPNIDEKDDPDDISGKTDSYLSMNGSEIFKFALDVVPDMIESFMNKSNLKPSEIKLYIFHQANKFMLEHLRKKMKIPSDKFFINYADVGNAVSASIPIALKDAIDKRIVKKGMKVLLVGFGVGYSWGTTLIRL